MRRTKEAAENTQRELLDAALTTFSQKGYQATRLEDIAQIAGVTRGAIYHHFGNKADLYIALVDQAAGQGEELIRVAASKGGTFEDVVTRIFASYFSTLENDTRFRDVVKLTNSNVEGIDDLKAIVQRKYEEAKVLVENIAGFFRLGIDNNQLRADLDPETAARALIAYLNGVTMLWLANTDAFSIEADTSNLTDIYLRGILLQ